LGSTREVMAMQALPSDIPGGKGYFAMPLSKVATKITIEAIKLADSIMVVYGHSKILPFRLQLELRNVMSIDNFDILCKDIAVHDQSVCTLELSRINIRSFPGPSSRHCCYHNAEGGRAQVLKLLAYLHQERLCQGL
jgi:hypothetical protein